MLSFQEIVNRKSDLIDPKTGEMHRYANQKKRKRKEKKASASRIRSEEILSKLSDHISVLYGKEAPSWRDNPEQFIEICISMTCDSLGYIRSWPYGENGENEATYKASHAAYHILLDLQDGFDDAAEANGYYVGSESCPSFEGCLKCLIENANRRD